MNTPGRLHTVGWRLLIEAVALLLTTEHRREWIAEWQSELWYAAAELTGKGLTFIEVQCELARFCRGAVQDAALLQWRRENRRAAVASPFACLGFIALGVIVFAGVGFLLP